MMGNRTAHGYTLLELLAYLSVLGVAVNLAGALFVSATRLHMLGDDAVTRMQALDEIADAFTDAVQESLGAVDGADGYATGEDTLVLRMPGDRFAVLGRLRGDARFVVMKFHAGDAGAPTFLETCSYPLHELSFERTLEGGAIAMRVHLQRESARDGAGHTVIATPRSVAPEAP
jgi:hypothetical protein